MLPSELLITRTKKDRIYPDFLPLDHEHLELAGELIGVYQNFTGRKKSEIEEIIEEFEQGLNFRRIRALRTLLERRCTFTSKYLIEPVLARRAVFEAASSRSITTQIERSEVIETVAHNLDVSVEALEQSLWADLESEVLLADFEPVTPEELVKWYNLALAQTLLFKSTGMTITIKSRAPEIFRAIKYFGLMYLQEEGNKVRIEGASSLLKLSERYGTAMAKLLPVIVKSDGWMIDAEIVIRRDTPRIYHFIMDSRDKGLLTGEEPMRESVPDFDSSVEQKFYNEFVSLPVAKNWDLIREPDVLFTHNGIFIPDFKFQHKELLIETYFEIVGFWTDEYLKKKLRKLRALPITVLVAIDQNLAGFNAEPFGFGGLDQPVILFSKKVPIGEVVRYLAAIEQEAITKQVERLKQIPIELEGDIIPIKDIAKRYFISQEAVRACLKHPEYVAFKDVVVKKELLRELKDKLVSIQKYGEARRIIDRFGLSNPDEVLAHLGFKVQWKGLDPSAATIALQ